MDIQIHSFGAILSRENEGFLVKTSTGKQRIPADAATSITLGRATMVTTDALFLAIERGIPILLVEKSGAPKGRVWSANYGSISTIRKGQLEFTRSRKALDWIKGVLARKVLNQSSMVRMMSATYRAIDDTPPSGDVGSVANDMERRRDDMADKLDAIRDKIGTIQGEMVADVAPKLRGLEGTASRIYFEAMNIFIPREYRFAQRSQHPAFDVANAMLNYAYGILYSHVEGALIMAGIDPYIGVLHRDDYNRPVLVYDVIEIFRYWADYVVFSLLGQRFINSDYYSLRDDGSVWLEHLGRVAIINALNDYLDELVDYEGLHRSRATHITLYAQRLADTMKKEFS